MGSHSYGAKTNGLFDTCSEMNFIVSERKPYYLVKMCDEWMEPHVRMTLGANIMFKRWHSGEPMPLGIVEEILTKLRADVSRSAR